MDIPRALWADEAGFIISAELILVATILVIGLVVGMAEIQSALVNELNDIGDAIGSLNQSFFFSGFSARKEGHRERNRFSGSSFRDTRDSCDDNQCELDCDRPRPERPKTD